MGNLYRMQLNRHGDGVLAQQDRSGTVQPRLLNISAWELKGTQFTFSTVHSSDFQQPVTLSGETGADVITLRIEGAGWHDTAVLLREETLLRILDSLRTASQEGGS